MLRHFAIISGVLLISGAVSATTVTLDFEGFPDSTILTTQYPGVSFSNAIILTCGISLNEFEFPPHSGVNVVSDNGGPMSIMFATPVTSFSGYFTYAEPLTIDAYDASSNLLTSTMSAYSNNEAMSGDPGSSPNEFLQLTSTTGMLDVTITGDPLGGSFVLDDATYVTPSLATPEPVFTPVIGVMVLLAVLCSRRSRLAIEA